MTPRAVSLPVTPALTLECKFWLEDDSLGRHSGRSPDYDCCWVLCRREENDGRKISELSPRSVTKSSRCKKSIGSVIDFE
jgi:hypothetical protein